MTENVNYQCCTFDFLESNSSWTVSSIRYSEWRILDFHTSPICDTICVSEIKYSDFATTDIQLQVARDTGWIMEVKIGLTVAVFADTTFDETLSKWAPANQRSNWVDDKNLPRYSPCNHGNQGKLSFPFTTLGYFHDTYWYKSNLKESGIVLGNY